MSLKIGTSFVKDTYIGTKKVKQAYVGKDLVYSDGTDGLIYSLYQSGLEYVYWVSGIEEGCDPEVIVIPAAYRGLPVTRIDSSAFLSKKNLKRVYVLGENLGSVWSGAFNGCSNLTDISLPGSVTSIGDTAFRDCTSLVNIEIPKNVKSVGYRAFYGCTSLERIVIPDSTTTLGDESFYNCTNLSEVTIGEGVSSLGTGIFWNCTNLLSITIGSKVSAIESTTFYNCNSLAEFYFNGIADKWAKIDFKGGIIGHPLGLTDNSTLYVKDDSVYGGYTTVISITTSVKDYAFYRCKSAKTLYLSGHATTVGQSAFYGCTNLYDIYIRGAIASFGYNAFYKPDSGNRRLYLEDYYYQGALKSILNSWIQTEFADYDANPFYRATQLFVNGVDASTKILKLPDTQEDIFGNSLQLYRILPYVFAHRPVLYPIIYDVYIPPVYSEGNLQLIYPRAFYCDGSVPSLDDKTHIADFSLNLEDTNDKWLVYSYDDEGNCVEVAKDIALDGSSPLANGNLSYRLTTYGSEEINGTTYTGYAYFYFQREYV